MVGMEIKGYKQASLIEWPGLIVDILYLAGCDFRCPFCHNPDLIEIDTVESYNVNDVLEEIHKRAKGKWLDGISITGGEPAINKRLGELLKILKSWNLKTKIDTNGNHPIFIQKLIEEKLLDYIAMDIKAIPEKYHLAAGKKVNLKNIEKTIEIIINSKLDHEFRTTVVPTIVEPLEDLPKIAQMISGAKRFYIQQFRPLRCYNKNFEKLIPYTLYKLENAREKIKHSFELCEVR